MRQEKSATILPLCGLALRRLAIMMVGNVPELKGRSSMRCPFPGMDPYIERPSLWPDFHDSLIPAISAALQPVLRPRYAALIQDRRYADGFREPYIQIINPAARNRLISVIEVVSPNNKTAGSGRKTYLKKRKEVLA